MRGLKFESIHRHPVGIICSNSSLLARQPAVRPSVIARSMLICKIRAPSASLRVSRIPLVRS
jgi:hypothetical protein